MRLVRSGIPWKTVVPVLCGVLLLTGGVELWMGRSLFGPDGKFGVWAGNVWTSECSQRVADPYSFSHITHGLVFYACLWLIGGGLPVQSRLFLALFLEAGWEIVENSPVIIQRYRETTIALGYDGDSVLNSLSDILLMAAGFLFAWRVRPWCSVLLLIVMEVALLWWVRDNFILNVLMLVWPVEAIKAWQTAGRPL
jgi:hypothetical protein